VHQEISETNFNKGKSQAPCFGLATENVRQLSRESE